MEAIPLHSKRMALKAESTDSESRENHTSNGDNQWQSCWDIESMQTNNYQTKHILQLLLILQLPFRSACCHFWAGELFYVLLLFCQAHSKWHHHPRRLVSQSWPSFAKATTIKTKIRPQTGVRQNSQDGPPLERSISNVFSPHFCPFGVVVGFRAVFTETMNLMPYDTTTSEVVLLLGQKKLGTHVVVVVVVLRVIR